MKILYFTKSKPYTLKALKRMKEEGHYVSVAVKSKNGFIGISNIFGKRIREDNIFPYLSESRCA